MRSGSYKVLCGLASVIVLALGLSSAFAQMPGIYSVDAKVSDGHLNMRHGPNTSYSVVTEIPAGSTGIKVSECGKRENPSHKPWCKAEWNGHAGWLSSCCIVASSTSASIGIVENESRAIQRALMWLGHYPGPIDGEVGPGTLAAIKKFQAETGTSATGSLTASEMNRLKTAGESIQKELGYVLRTDARTGVRIGLPTTWSKREEAWKLGSKFSGEPNFHVLTFARTGISLDQLYEELKNQKKRRVWYSPLRDNWFVLSGVDNEGSPNETHVYIRAQSSGTNIRGFLAIHKPNFHPNVDALITIISSDFEAFPGEQLVATATQQPADKRYTSPLNRERHDLDEPRRKLDIGPAFGTTPAERNTDRWAGYKRKLESLYECLMPHYRQAIDVAMPPADFSRIVTGACYDAEAELRKASVQVALSYNLGAALGTQTGNKTISEAKTHIVSEYTQNYYRAVAKRRESTPPSSPAPKEKQISSGTGFLVSAAGHVLTNAHVVEGCEILRARLADGSHSPATLVASNKRDDLALLKMAPSASAKSAVLRIAKSVRTGEDVVVFGFPLQSFLASSGNLSTGIVTALAGLGDSSHHLQISAPVQPGNSGGPLMDKAGNVIGIVVGKLGLKAVSVTKDISQNVNFAIKAPIAAAFMDAHGISYRTATSDADLSVPDVGDRARQFTVNIECEE